MIAAALAAGTICLSPPNPDAMPDQADRAIAHPRFPSGPVPAAKLSPLGWRVEKRLTGDIDGDGRPDLVLLLRGVDQACMTAELDILGKPRAGALLDTNPRALVVALGSPDGYRVVASNDRLIPRNLASQVEDPLENGGVTLKGGALKVRIHFWTSMGSYGVSNRDFTFRWRDGALVLVGFDDMEMMRNTLDETARSFDYLSHRASTATTSGETQRKSVKWAKLRTAPLRNLTQLGDGWEFEP